MMEDFFFELHPRSFQKTLTPIFSSFGFWYFGHFSCDFFFHFFFRLAHFALQNVCKDYVIFSYFQHFLPKVTKKQKQKDKMNKTSEHIFG